jgi:hypothetical protein
MWHQKHTGDWISPEFDGTVSFKYHRDRFGRADTVVTVHVRGVPYCYINTEYLDDFG